MINSDVLQDRSGFIREHESRSTFEAPLVTDQHCRPSRLDQEEVLRLVYEIFLPNAGNPAAFVVFAGIEDRRGCSEICASIAEGLAANDRSEVCLVDANFRSPAMTELFGIPNHFGLTDSLTVAGPIRSFAHQVSDYEGLWLLSAGATSAHSAGLLSSRRLRERLRELRAEFDFVIVDAPPLSTYADALALGQLADGVVLVIEAGSTRREITAQAAASLRTSKVPILAAVLNNFVSPLPSKVLDRL
jgi:Mrp family chromosome partitioning ATPase